MSRPNIYIDDIPDESYVGRIKQLGVEQYCIIYQNSVDPAATTGVIDVGAVVKKIENNAALGGGASFQDAQVVVLDFDDPYMWPMMVGPEFFKKRDDGVVYDYNSINSNLVTAITELRARYPDKQWGYYSMPTIPASICKDGDPIRMVTPPGTGTYITNASEEQLKNLKKHLTSSFRAVADASDFVSVSLYQIDRKDLDSLGLDRMDPLRSELGGDICCNIAADKKKFAWVAPVFFGFVNATGVNSKGKVFDIISAEETISDVVKPARQHGIDGLFVWLASNYRISQITSPLSRGGHEGLRTWFNANFLANTGAPSNDDSYWTAPHMVAAIKTIFTDWLYRFCEKLVKGINSKETNE